MSNQTAKRELDSADAANAAKRQRVEPADLSFFLRDHSVGEFEEKYWGKEILHLAHGDASGFNEKLKTCRLEECWKTLGKCEKAAQEEGHPGLDYGWALDCCKVNDDGKKEKTSPDHGAVKVEEVKKLYETGSTVQWHQVQHFCPHIAKLLSDLEDFFGDTVGCNVYLTPPGGKGLAPHYDCVDVFVCQVEGSKTWNLHRGGKVMKHPLKDSGDLSFDEAAIGPKVKTVTLNKGDFLYLPRGTVHYATAKEGDKGSSHITISTYSENHKGGLFGNLLLKACDIATKEHELLRENLPIKAFEHFGTVPPATIKDAKLREQKRKAMIEKVESAFLPLLKPFLSKAMDVVADHYKTRFLAHRLPPSNVIQAADDKDDAPKLVNLEGLEKGTAVIEARVRGYDHLSVVTESPFEDDDMPSDNESIEMSGPEDDSAEKAEGDKAEKDKAEGDKSEDKVTAEKAEDKKGEKDKNSGEKPISDEEMALHKAVLACTDDWGNEDLLYLVDCLSNSVHEHMFEGPGLDKTPGLVPFPKRFLPIVNKLFFSDKASHEMPKLEALVSGIKREESKKMFMQFFIKDLITF